MGSQGLLLVVVCCALLHTRSVNAEAAACKRLKDDKNLDCAACVDIPADDNSCTRTAVQDFEAEKTALFGGNAPRPLWNSTAFLFKDDNMWDVKLHITKENWEYLNTDPAAEKYVNASITIGDLGTWSDVGVRFKGFFGSLRACLINWWKCHKLSYKVKFNYKNKTQTFFGLKKLQFHASLTDRTKIRERLTYSLFREMGVAAPRMSFSNIHLQLSDTTQDPILLGVHLMTEVIDGRFTDAFFPGGDGNLYKEAWPGMTGEAGERAYKDGLRTNEEDGEVERLLKFSTDLLAASDDYELTEVLEEYFHVEQLARYFAVDRAVEHWDGPMNFRTTQGSTGKVWNHNYFLYEDDEDEANATGVPRKIQIVAWDTDGTWNWDLSNSEWSSIGLRPDWDAPVCEPGSNSNNCIQCNTFPIQAKTQHMMPPSCMRVFRGLGRGLRKYYMDAAKDLLSGPLQPCRINSKIDRWSKLLKPYLVQEQAKSLWPAIEAAKPGEEGFNPMYPVPVVDSENGYLRGTVVPHWVGVFKRSVSCDRSYDADAWGEGINTVDIDHMLKLDHWKTGSTNWIGGDPSKYNYDGSKDDDDFNAASVFSDFSCIKAMLLISFNLGAVAFFSY